MVLSYDIFSFHIDSVVKARARPDIRWVYVEKFQTLDKVWVTLVICVRQIFMCVHQTELSRYAVEIRFRVEKLRRSRKSEERWKREKTISLLKKKEMTREIWQMLGLKIRVSENLPVENL